MVARLFVVACFSVAFAAGQVGASPGRSGSVGNEGIQTFSDEDTLRSVTEQAGKKVAETSTRINNADSEFTSITKDRVDSLLWQCVEHKSELHKVIKETVFKGIDKNKPLNSFQCISDRARESFEKLDAVKVQIPVHTQSMTEKEVAKVKSFSLVMREFGDYVEVLYRTKSEEMKKASSDAIKKRILKDAMQKMTLLESVLDSISKQMTDIKYNFFEDYIHYAFDVANSLRKIQSEGAEHIKKCLA